MKKFLYPLQGLLLLLGCFGCSEESNPLPSRSHPIDWNLATSANFHGKKVIASGKVSCTACHGYDLSGGDTGIACASCHALYPHDAQWTVIAASSFHGAYIAAQNWSMSSCQKCHGSDYQGGDVKVACTSCHSAANGPESCSTCHGSQKNAAPPKDLHGHTARSALGVGAHQPHIDRGLQCKSCHAVPASSSDAGHIDGNAPAEVLSALAWNRETGSCATPCHTQTDKMYFWNR